MIETIRVESVKQSGQDNYGNPKSIIKAQGDDRFIVSSSKKLAELQPGTTIEVDITEFTSAKGTKYYRAKLPQKDGFTPGGSQPAFSQAKQERNEKTEANIARSVAYKGVIELIVAGKASLDDIYSLVDEHTELLTVKPTTEPDKPTRVEPVSEEVDIADDIPF